MIIEGDLNTKYMNCVTVIVLYNIFSNNFLLTYFIFVNLDLLMNLFFYILFPW
jgi:hypothetical protein